MKNLQLMAAVATSAVIAAAGCAPMQEMEPSLLADKVRQELAGEQADSDAAVILYLALSDAAKANPEAGAVILREAQQRAAEAKSFKIVEESPLPADWPRPSLPGLIRIKTYPPVRTAWVRAPENRNGQFMVLFRHIQSQQIAMTAPVVMEYSDAAGKDPSKLGGTEAMAFLYRRTDQGKTGNYGAVAVEDDKPLQVVSLGLKGSYSEASFRDALAKLQQWLAAHPEWQAAGPPRVLAYNSPFLLWWMKYSEVQIPVAASKDSSIKPGKSTAITLPRATG